MSQFFESKLLHFTGGVAEFLRHRPDATCSRQHAVAQPTVLYQNVAFAAKSQAGKAGQNQDVVPNESSKRLRKKLITQTKAHGLTGLQKECFPAHISSTGDHSAALLSVWASPWPSSLLRQHSGTTPGCFCGQHSAQLPAFS